MATAEDFGFVADAPAGPKAEDFGFVADPPPEPNTSAMKSFVNKNVADHFAATSDTEESKLKANEKKQSAHTAEGFIDALQAGYQGSATGLSIRQKLPDQILPEHAPLAMKIASQVGSLADLPMMGITGLAAAETGPVGATAAAFAVPAAVRKMWMDHLEKGDMQTAGDFASRLMSTSWEAIKGATTGAVTALTGGASKAAGPLAQAAAETIAMTTTGAALEGHLPEVSDFVAGGIVIGGMHGIGVLPKLRNEYAATGEKPADVAMRAQTDVQLKQDLIAGNMNEPSPPVKLVDGQIIQKPVTPEDLAPKAVADPRKGLPQLSEDEQAILSKIGEPSEKESLSLKDRWRDFYTKKADKNAPLKYAIEDAEVRGAAIAPDKDAYITATRFAAHQDTINSFYQFGTRDWKTGEVNGEGLNDIYSDVPDKDLDRFRAYGMASRGLELNERGIKPWKEFNQEQAQKVVDAGKGLYEDVNQRRVAFKNRVLKYAKDAGLIDDAAEARMVEANKQSFPFHRVQEPDVFGAGGKSGGSILKRIYGSDKLILDPILSDYQDTAMMLKKAMVNEVRNNFYENMVAGGLVDENNGAVANPDAYLRRVPSEMTSVVVGSEELTKALSKQGLDLEPDDITVFRPEMGSLKDNQIAFKVNGKRVVYEGPQGVIDSLKALDGDKTAMSLWVKAMAGFAKMERLGTTTNPAFGFAHFFRAATMSGVYTKTGQIPFYHAAGVVGDIIGKSDLYRDAEYHGAFSQVFDPINKQFMEKNIEAASIETNWQSKMWNVVKHPLEATEAWIKLTDSASRLAEYKRAVEQGKTKEEAAYLARNVVVDYQKIGLEKSAMRASTAFIGVHINSMDQLRLAFVNDPKSTIARLSVISAISAGLWAVNNIGTDDKGDLAIKPDPAIDALPAWQKGVFWNINLDRSGDPKKATILRLPKPWAAGIAFGTGAEVALDVAFRKDPHELEHFGRTLFSSVVPVPIPNMTAPMMEQTFNQQLTSGRPLVSEKQRELLPELRYEPYTSETARQLAKLIGYVGGEHIGQKGVTLATAGVVENYIHSWTGTMGMMALKISDEGLRAAGVGNQHTIADKPLAEYPFLDSFISRYPYMKNQNVQDFYANEKEFETNSKSLKESANRGDVEMINKIIREHSHELGVLTGIGKSIAIQRQVIQNIQYRTDMPPVEKRQLIDGALYRIGQEALMGNKIYSDLKKAQKGE